MSDIVFMDTETLGLDIEAPVWEFAAIRRNSDGQETQYHCFIKHKPEPWLSSLPDEFANDYRARFDLKVALGPLRAAEFILDATAGAHIVGAVPNFDTERLTRLLNWCNIEPTWHYHLIDIENLAVGWLAAKSVHVGLPWKSDDISRALGVDPEQFRRHTAMGDVAWCKAQYEVIFGGGLKPSSDNVNHGWRR